MIKKAGTLNATSITKLAADWSTKGDQYQLDADQLRTQHKEEDAERMLAFSKTYKQAALQLLKRYKQDG